MRQPPIRPQDRGTRTEGENSAIPEKASNLVPRASFLFKLMRVDLPLHRVEELGPRVGLELGDELAGFPGPALRAGEIRPFLAELVEDLEDMGALDAFVIVQGHKTPPARCSCGLWLGVWLEKGSLPFHPAPERPIPFAIWCEYVSAPGSCQDDKAPSLRESVDEVIGNKEDRYRSMGSENKWKLGSYEERKIGVD